MTYPLTTTLKALRDAGACLGGYNKGVRRLQNKQFTEEDEARESYIRFAHKEPITLESICNNNGLEDAVWAPGSDCERIVDHVEQERRE